MRRISLGATALAALVSWACDRPVQAGSNRNSDIAIAASSLIVDSILPSGEALLRFQSELPHVTELHGAASSRDELVWRFIDAIEKSDTATLRSLLISKPEYAFLYFPSSVYSRTPYELPPDIAWLLSEENSRKGITRLTRRLGARSLGFRGYECASPVTEGENRFWRSCDVIHTDVASGRQVRRILFGAIIERTGRYKFLSYANDF